MSHLNNSGIYEIKNIANGNIYIGSTVNFNARWRDHLHRFHHNKHGNKYLQNAWNKYGVGAFEFNKLIICSKNDLLMYEQRCLDLIKPEYNIALTASAVMSGRKHTAESLKKMSIVKAGKKLGEFTLAHRMAISAANKGRRNTPEQLRKQSLGQTGKKRGPYSAEHRAKIGAANKGKPSNNLGKKASESTKLKISAAKIRYWKEKRSQNEILYG